MTDVRLHVLGCGDAFNSGARLHPCFLIEAADVACLLDCGPSVLAAMKARGISPEKLDAVFISHLHGDHFGGVPFLLLDLDILHRRTRELVIAGPAGVRERIKEVMEVLFPGTPLSVLPVRYVELESRVTTAVGSVQVTAYPVIHVPETNPHALRLEIDGRTIGYSGDTEWTDELITVADGADVFLCESSTYDHEVPGHLSARTLVEKRDLLRSERVILIHMGEQVLRQLPMDRFEGAEDGMSITL